MTIHRTWFQGGWLVAGWFAAWPLGCLGIAWPQASAGDTRLPEVRQEPFGKTGEGEAVELYILRNASGLEARVMTLGATLVTVRTPDRHGKLDDITLHKDSLAEYLKGHPLLGSVVGRYANRIAGARFVIDGIEYPLERNLGKHHIHGGRRGFSSLVWKADPWADSQAAGVRLSLVSPDGHAGYPGTLRVQVLYKLSNENELVMDYTATTDKPTHVNLTNHAYWNLAGAESQDVMGHLLQLEADHYLPADELLIPTGEIRSVRGTPMDFTQPMTIGSRTDQVPRKHYDDCYVLNKKPNERLSRAALVTEPQSGRTMQVWTTQPGVQLYTGNRRGLCLETQHFPNAPNEPKFPSTLLRPGETYRQTTIHKFGILTGT
jgi:aldose 1-epimerase